MRSRASRHSANCDLGILMHHPKLRHARPGQSAPGFLCRSTRLRACAKQEGFKT